MAFAFAVKGTSRAPADIQQQQLWRTTDRVPTRHPRKDFDNIALMMSPHPGSRRR
jgi:hypothetical protein